MSLSGAPGYVPQFFLIRRRNSHPRNGGGEIARLLACTVAFGTTEEGKATSLISYDNFHSSNRYLVLIDILLDLRN